MGITKAAGSIFMATLLGGSLTGCTTHAYAAPVVVAVQTGPDQAADVAWFIEDGVRVVRCVNGPERPICRRAHVE